MDVREGQSLKQRPPKLVTEDGILMDVREEQKENARSPILVTEFGIVIDSKIPSKLIYRTYLNRTYHE